MAPRLETPAPRLETPWRCASKPQVRRASKPLGTNFETKIFKFFFLAPLTKTSYTTPHYHPKYENYVADKMFWVEDPFKL